MVQKRGHPDAGECAQRPHCSESTDQSFHPVANIVQSSSYIARLQCGANPEMVPETKAFWPLATCSLAACCHYKDTQYVGLPHEGEIGSLGFSHLCLYWAGAMTFCLSAVSAQQPVRLNSTHSLIVFPLGLQGCVQTPMRQIK